MATAAQKAKAAEKLAAEVDVEAVEVEANDAASNGFTITKVDALPPKPSTVRTNWWETSVVPVLDADPGEWFHVYTGNADSPSPDRNALSRVVRTKKALADAGITDYEIEKRGLDVFARRIVTTDDNA
jgi:hypothetical protein